MSAVGELQGRGNSTDSAAFYKVNEVRQLPSHDRPLAFPADLDQIAIAGAKVGQDNERAVEPLGDNLADEGEATGGYF